ncbi:MAG: hypothetical protein BGO86_11865 [Chryseobacterium sp. 36-9]|nr:MAG: hypothetical protein BGO86_11865 [Chryseobacterium sp. 36-9]
MKKSIYKIIFIGGICLSTISCLNDLDQVPEDGRVTVENQFENDPYGTYVGLNAKLYAQLSIAGQGGPNGEVTDASDLDGFDGGSSNYFRVWWSTQELLTDEAKNSWEGDDGMIDLSSANLNSSNKVIDNFFYRIFTAISKTNEFVRESTDEKINSRGLNESQKTEVKYYRAEARFLRALLYFHAIDNFGNVPFIDETDLPGTTAPKVRTRQQVFSFIEGELKDIIPQLRPARSIYGRADKAAAGMLLAKLYLNAGVYTGTTRYPDCKKALEDYVLNAGYTIDTNYADTFKGDNNTSSEIIFPIVSDPNNAQSYGNMSYVINAAGIGKTDGIDLQPAFYLGSSGQWGGNKTTREFVGLFNTSDKRAMFDKRTGLIEFISDLSVDRQGYRVTKFTNIRKDGSYIAGGSGSNFVDTDFPMFRLSDAYLMYAECALYGAADKNIAASTYLNPLRKRAGLADVSASDITEKFIIEERGRELYWEGHRRQDLIRFNRLSGSQYVWNWKGSANGNSLSSTINLMPIPYNQVIMNPNLKQNPGY